MKHVLVLCVVGVCGCAAEQVNPAPREAADELTRAQQAISRFITPQLHCEAYATMWCYRLAACGHVDWPAFRECRQTVKSETCGPLVAAAERGRRTFDGEWSLECLLGLGRELNDCSDDRQYGTRWWTDRREFSTFQSYCGRVFSFSGTGTEGQSCLLTQDCAPPLGCHGDGCHRTCRAGGTADVGESCLIGCLSTLRCDATTSTCQIKRLVGESCVAVTDCNPSATCDSSTRLCVALPVVGEPCFRGACASGGYCNGGTCVAAYIGGEGEACSVHQDCLRELACITATCQPRRAFGESCVGIVAGDCQDNLLCIGTPLRCGAPRIDGLGPAEGSPCRTQFDCRRDLYCDQVYGTCLARDGGRDLGEECTGGISSGTLDVAYTCGQDLTCEGYEPARVDRPGAPGRCVEVGPMTPCAAAFGAGSSRQDPCPRGYKCRADSAVSGSPFLCRPTVVDSLCNADRECAIDHYCQKGGSVSIGRCKPRAAEGEECFGASHCPPTLACVATSEGHRCRRPASLGEACATTSPARICPEGFECFSGACRNTVNYQPDPAAEPCGPFHTASPSPPCLFDYACVDGACVQAGEIGEPCRRDRRSPCEPGARCAPTGLCEPLNEAGAACTRDIDCASGACYSRLCINVCT